MVLKFYVGDFLEKHQRVQNCPEVTICDSLLVHDENHGLGLYMWGIASGSVGHRVSLEYGLGVSHRVGHGFGHGVVHGVSQFKSSF